MSAKVKRVIGAAGFAALLGVAMPAEAQYYPPPNNPGGIAGAIINSYQYGRYPYGNFGYNNYGSQARAVEQRLNGHRYNWYQGGNYNRYRNFGRVEGITRIEQKSYGIKVWGVASSGWGGYQGWNRQGYGSYGYGAGADLSWDCKVYRNGQIRDIDINRRAANWRGY